MSRSGRRNQAKGVLSVVAILATALASSPAFAASNSTLDVSVINASGAPVPGARVIALSFNNGNPDPSATKVAAANSAGVANFSGTNALADYGYYQVVAASQSFAPSIVDQFNAGAPGLSAAPQASTPTITIVLSSAGISGLGQIDAAISNASFNTLVFGQVGLESGGGAVAFGVGATDGTGAGTISFYNVALASAGTYQLSAFDAVQNRSASLSVSQNLDSPSTPLSAGALDFSNALRPVANLGKAQQTDTAGGLGVYGVVVDTNSNPVPYLQLNFSSQYKDQYGQTQYDWRGAGSDQNGTFQLYGLMPGVTYYASVYGGCGPSGACYEGFQSTAAQAGLGAAPGFNDFLYPSSTAVLRPTIQLKQMPPGSGRLAVYVKDQFGNSFPQAWIGLWPDGMPWQTSGGGACAGGPYPSNPGFKSLNASAATGYLLITDLTSGNYRLNAWTPYGGTSFNAGPNGQENWSGCGVSDTDDFRLTIDTASAQGHGGVYDQYGNIVSSGLAAVVVMVNVSTGANGVVEGTLTFPATEDLSQSPISIILYPKCDNGGNCAASGGFKGFSSTNTPSSLAYSIPVSSGQTYWLNVTSDYWGAIFPGGHQPQPDLMASSAAVVDIQFGPAGRIVGFVRKPDGSIYVPPTNSGDTPRVSAAGNSSWGQSQIYADGSFAIGGLLPGNYTLRVESSGSGFPYTAKQPAPVIGVVVNRDTPQDFYLADAVSVRPVVSPISTLPSLDIVTSCPSDGDCPPEAWAAYALPQGTPFNQAAALKLMVGGDAENVFYYRPIAGMADRCHGQSLAAAGFCASALPAGKTGSGYDFYLLRKGGFDGQNLAGGVRPHFVIESSSRNVVISPQFASGLQFSSWGGANGSTTPVQDVNLTPSPSLGSVQQATLSGTVTAASMINSRQFDELAGDFDRFLQYLPMVWIYDSTGALKAAGLVTPFPPNVEPLKDALDKSVNSGDYAAFTTLTGSSGWGPLGYEIRGLTAGTTYNLVVTTPNYPPFKTTALLGAANSTTTVNVNLDLNPGASLAGVVMSTDATPISGAQVTVKAAGDGQTTLTTDSSGAWSLSGLAAGQYQLLAVAAGFAQQAQIADVSGASLITVPTFNLPRSNASIAGTIYTNNPICPAATTCSAFGKTVLQNVTVYAYDDTINANSPTTVLPLYRAVTDSSGSYRLDGLVTGDSLGAHSYKLFVNAPGYYVANQTTQAVAGLLSGFDFALKPKPLDVGVFGRPAPPNYEFQITNYRQFSDGNAWISPAPFSSATSVQQPQTAFVERPDSQGETQLFFEYPLSSMSSGVVYVLRLVAQPNDPRAAPVVKEVQFGIDLPHNTCQSIDEALIGDDSGVNAQGLPNNLVSLDIAGGTGGNSSGLSLPAGGVIPIFSTAVPSMCMTETEASASTQASVGASTASFASGVYQVTLSSVNYTQKGVNLTLSYEQNGTSLDDLAVYTFDQASNQWQSIPGLQTINAINGTISVSGLKSLASVLRAPAAGTGFMALSDGKGYRPNAALLLPDDTGLFAVMRPSALSRGSYSGTTVKVYNFPNPFSLEPKTVNVNTASNACSGLSANSFTTSGTVIKMEIPGSVGGHGVLRIYTLSGRLVRELDQGTLSGGTCVYTNWDGRNKNGQPVANGVYYGILSVAGSKLQSGTFKMAVIK